MPRCGQLRCNFTLSWLFDLGNKYFIFTAGFQDRPSPSTFCRWNCLQLLHLHSGLPVELEIARGCCPIVLIWPAVCGFLHSQYVIRSSFWQAVTLRSVFYMLGGLICFRICLINSFIVLANDSECFCCFLRTWNCPFGVVVAD